MSCALVRTDVPLTAADLRNVSVAPTRHSRLPIRPTLRRPLITVKSYTTILSAFLVCMVPEREGGGWERERGGKREQQRERERFVPGKQVGPVCQGREW